MAGDGVGPAVRAARLGAGLTQRDLALRAGLSVGALRDLEQGRSAHPRAGTLDALARALELPSIDALRIAATASPDPATSTTTTTGEVPTTVPPPVRAPLAVRVLGPVAVLGPDGRRPVEGRGQSVTLGMLALHVGDDVSHHALAEVLWPAGAPASASGLLRSYVARLRRRLTPVGVQIVSGPGRYRLVAADDACDVSRFRADVRRADAAVDDDARSVLLGEALALWPPTPPTDLAEVRGLATAVALERERVRAAVLCAIAAVGCGRPERAVDLVVPLAERDPLDESLAAAAIAVLAAAGRMADVQAVHSRTRRALADDLGLDPGPELADAFQDALRRTGAGASADESSGPVEGGRSGTESTAAPRAPAQLPRTLRGFHGRSDELARVVDLLAAGPGAAPPVVVVSGMGGLGKTTFAVAAAHAVAAHYPGGQLFVDLDGVGEPLHPAAVIEHFLVSLGHDRESLPGDLTALVAAFRTTTATARCLVVLDNAASVEQVERLLPAGVGCGVIVTSRRSLTELDDALHLPLAVLSPVDARELVEAGIGRERVADEPEATERIVALCDGLPLALRMVVARLSASPSWRIADVAGMLDVERGRLDVLRSGSRAVRASFELSHRALPAGTARVFRVSAVVPGPTLTPAAVAVALGHGAGEVEVRTALDDLVDRGMLGAAVGGRYAFHDLLREFADEQGLRHPDDTARARTRVLQWLERTARGATGRVFPHRVGAVPGGSRVSSPDLDDPVVEAAGRWLDIELDTLAAAVAAAATVHPALAWRLADAASGAFRRAATSQEFEHAARTGLAAAELVRDERGAALMCESLARAYVARCDHDAALEWFGRAAELAVATGWAEFEVSVRENRGISLLFLGRHADATADFETALRLARTTGQRYWEAACRNDLGNVAVLHGRVGDAKTHYLAAWAINDELDDTLGGLVNLSNLAHAERLAGRPEQAWEHVVAALDHPHITLDRLMFVETGIMQAEIALDLGRPAVATDLATRAAGWTAHLEQPALAARAGLALARARLETGEALAAARTAREALATARRVRDPELTLDAHLVLSDVALRTDELAAARRQAAAAVRLAAHLENPAGTADAALARARVLLHSGDVAAARDEVLLAEATFRRCGQGRGLAEAARVLAQLDDPAGAGSRIS